MDQESIIPYIAKKKFLRPLNYSNNFPGNGYGSFIDKDGNRIIVINILCNLFMQSLETLCTDKKSTWKFQLKNNCDAIFIDLHGEAASEKQAFANMLDGKVQQY